MMFFVKERSFVSILLTKELLSVVCIECFVATSEVSYVRKLKKLSLPSVVRSYSQQPFCLNIYL